jgi:hypothetical protein
MDALHARGKRAARESNGTVTGGFLPRWQKLLDQVTLRTWWKHVFSEAQVSDSLVKAVKKPPG